MSKLSALVPFIGLAIVCSSLSADPTEKRVGIFKIEKIANDSGNSDMVRFGISFCISRASSVSPSVVRISSAGARREFNVSHHAQDSHCFQVGDSSFIQNKWHALCYRVNYGISQEVVQVYLNTESQIFGIDRREVNKSDESEILQDLDNNAIENSFCTAATS